MKPKILNKQNVAQTRFLNLVTTSFEDKNGKVSNWVSAERPGKQNAVVIVAVVPYYNPIYSNSPKGNRDDKLVVIKEYRVPIQGYEFGLPAGLIDPGQSIEETAKRELKEETGLDFVKFIRPVTPFVYNSPGMTNEAVSMAFIEAEGEISKKDLQDSEDITTELYSRAAVQDLMAEAMEPKSDIMIGAKAWLVFERFVKYGDI